MGQRCPLTKTARMPSKVKKRMIEYLGPESSPPASAKTERSHLEKKKINGRYYLYRYQSYRDVNCRVRKRMIDYLGPVSASSKVFRTKAKEVEDETK